MMKSEMDLSMLGNLSPMMDQPVTCVNIYLSTYDGPDFYDCQWLLIYDGPAFNECILCPEIYMMDQTVTNVNI